MGTHRTSRLAAAAAAAASLVLVLVLGGGAGGCAKTDFSFDGPPLEEFLAAEGRFGAPTGVYDESTKEWLAEQAAAAWPFARALGQITALYPDFFRPQGRGAGDVADGGAATQTAALTASGYAHYSCPGRDLARPDLTFDNGVARVESDALALDGFKENVVARFGLEFERCDVGDSRLEGLSWGLIGGGTEGVLLLLDVVTTEASAPPAPLRADALWQGDGLALLLTHPDGGTFRLGLATATGLADVALVAANGVWSCAFDPTTGATGCTSPDDESTP